MTELATFTFKKEALDKLSLPFQDYFLPIETLEAGLIDIDKIPKELLLHGLQLRMAEKGANYKEYHEAVISLCNLFNDDGVEGETFVEGDNWSVLYGNIDLVSDEIVTIQRKDELLAALKQVGEHLAISFYQPLDDDALTTIRFICADIDKMTGETIGRNKLRYAAHRANSFGQSYAADAGQSYISYWQYGLGISHGGETVEPWKRQISLNPLPSKHIGTQLYVNEFFHQHGFSFEGYFSAHKPKDSANIVVTKGDEWPRIQFLACLLGGAIGDAFGAPVEFISRQEIINMYGENGITDFAKAYGKVGAITDDTQMTLFTAEGLIRSWVRGCFKGITSELSCIGHAYQRWYQTQGYRSPGNLHVETDGYLWDQKELHSQRAPGNTCLSALAEMESFESPAMNSSKGCGGVMRVAPIALYCWRLKNKKTVDDCFQLASDAANLTHGHATGYLASGAFAAIIYQILEGNSLLEACMSAIGILQNYDSHLETTQMIESAMRYSKYSMPPHEAIKELGEGWIAEEALAISIYCVLVAKNFKELMKISVSHDGDSDSTGAIAGNMWGTLYGMIEWPEKWIEGVELKHSITQIAHDIYNFPLWGIGLYSTNEKLNDTIWNRYLGC